LTYEPAVIDELIDVIKNKLHEPLRACHPRDILNQIRWAARYEQKEMKLDRDAMLTAVEAYFGTSSEEPDGYRA
jgi:hypothetical protein